MARGGFNGRLADPVLMSVALPVEEVLELAAAGRRPLDVLVARWDFARNPSSTLVEDVGPHGLHGHARQMPARAVTDHEWDGSALDYRCSDGRGYGAIHFHEDDLEDADWEADLELEIPAGLESGTYAIELTAGALRELIPFFVLPRREARPAPTAVLMPTFTYQAYANERSILEPEIERYAWVGRVFRDGDDRYVRENPGLGPSLYDQHLDGDHCVYSSRLRPCSTLRPLAIHPLLGAPRDLGEDLHLLSWLDLEGERYDVVTDEALHAEGAELLTRYRVLVTGAHPEYWSAPMLEAVEAFVGAGGRLMYLGGNGFHWVTGVHPERPHVIEVRRGGGLGSVAAQRPGEAQLATTGEPGGLWHLRGRAPHRLVGVGAAAEGRGGRAAGYVRLPASFDERAAFVFDGVAADEVIGEFGSVEGGAAGDEVDRLDFSLGTPAHALLLATSSGRHGEHVRLLDPFLVDEPAQLGTPAGGGNPAVRADMVFFETAAGGAVFSVGSISWRGSLQHDEGRNNVATITRNVLRRFVDPAPFALPAN